MSAAIDAPPRIYAIDKAGGEYTKHYLRYKDEHTTRLRRAEKSYRKVIAEHERWIEDPALKRGNGMDPAMVRLYTDSKWPADIARNRAYPAIIISILQERKNDSAQ